MITLENLQKTYRHKGREIHALHGVSLHVAPGEIYGVVGQSGAGKSTIIRCVNLLERPDSGRVIVAGQELTALAPAKLLRARHKIGMIFQHFNLLASRTVYDNIALPLELVGADKKTIAAKVHPLLALTGLEDTTSHYPAQLSGASPLPAPWPPNRKCCFRTKPPRRLTRKPPKTSSPFCATSTKNSASPS